MRSIQAVRAGPTLTSSLKNVQRLLMRFSPPYPHRPTTGLRAALGFHVNRIDTVDAPRCEPKYLFMNRKRRSMTKRRSIIRWRDKISAHKMELRFRSSGRRAGIPISRFLSFSKRWVVRSLVVTPAHCWSCPSLTPTRRREPRNFETCRMHLSPPRRSWLSRSTRSLGVMNCQMLHGPSPAEYRLRSRC